MCEHDNIPYDSIEKLFQFQAKRFEISFREKDWLKLKKRIDLLDKLKIGAKALKQREN